jgi:carbonic anhydrase/acetyltransferase-like protein (isoleucine patch superfamily)
VVIIAPYILIDKGFKGQIQAFASKFIRIGEEVNLTYPSIAMVLKTELTPTIPQNMIIEKNATIHGLIGVYQFNKTDLPPIPSLDIKATATVIGQVYTNEKIYLQGQVFGNVTCAGFRVQTAASIYDNHIFNTTIDYSKRPNDYLSPAFLEKTVANQVILDTD